MHLILVSVVLLSTVHAPQRLKRPTFPPVELYGPNLGETLRFRPYDDKGRARRPALGELTRFLRCRHTGRQRKVDPRLMRALYTVGRHYAGKRVEVYSGYRPRRRFPRRRRAQRGADRLAARDLPPVGRRLLSEWRARAPRPRSRARHLLDRQRRRRPRTHGRRRQRCPYRRP